MKYINLDFLKNNNVEEYLKCVEDLQHVNSQLFSILKGKPLSKSNDEQVSNYINAISKADLKNVCDELKKAADEVSHAENYHKVNLSCIGDGDPTLSMANEYGCKKEEVYDKAYKLSILCASIENQIYSRKIILSTDTFKDKLNDLNSNAQPGNN